MDNIIITTTTEIKTSLRDGQNILLNSTLACLKKSTILKPLTLTEERTPHHTCRTCLDI
ncbi:hypothetical protein LSO4A_70001 [Candidatus Liberibacter solanacearum]